MSDNTRIWSVLGTTDPKHTKSFNRAGGFKGTSVKPIYTDLKMTEMFGPCGIGWGMSEPQYQLVNGPEGEVAVYCWVSVWFVENGQRSEPVWGVGGDFAVKKNKYGLVADDEAFKKAFTDALGNAMKHLGMSADVHMGQFDDDKYVTALRREMDGNGDTKPQPKPNGATRPEDFWKRESYAIPFKGDWQKWDGSMRKAIDAAPSAETLNKLWNDNLEQREGLKVESARAHALLDEHFQKRWHALAQAPEREVA